MKHIVWFSLLLVALAGFSHAEDARQYCEEMYPPESYEPGERAQYIEECMAVTQSEEETYYEGTVEDYVNAIPEEQPQQEADTDQAVESEYYE